MKKVKLAKHEQYIGTGRAGYIETRAANYIGNVVKLRSGGPTMQIINYDFETDNCICAWFAGGELKQHQFGRWALKVYEY